MHCNSCIVPRPQSSKILPTHLPRKREERQTSPTNSSTRRSKEEEGEKTISNQNPVKIAPERAAEVMRFVGTAEGEALYPHDLYMKATSYGRKTFLYVELLHLSQIKSYMGKPSLLYASSGLQRSRGRSFLNFGMGEGDVENDDEDEEDA
jgi:hypothetical protein